MIKAFKSVDLDGLNKEFVEVISKIEAILGEDLAVTSGYRSPEHPIEAKKRNPGEHTTGLAIDVAAVGGTKVLEVVKAALECGISRVGINRHKNFVHLGADTSRVKSIWTYDK